MEVAKHQNDAAAFATDRNPGWRLEVGENRLDRQSSPRCDSPQLGESAAIPIDPDHGDSGLGRGETVATAAAREIDHRTQPTRRPNSVELIAKERGGRGNLQDGLRFRPVARTRATRDAPGSR